MKVSILNRTSFIFVMKTKESLNSAGQHFYQYQQNKQPSRTSNH